MKPLQTKPYPSEKLISNKMQFTGITLLSAEEAELYHPIYFENLAPNTDEDSPDW